MLEPIQIITRIPHHQPGSTTTMTTTENRMSTPETRRKPGPPTLAANPLYAAPERLPPGTPYRACRHCGAAFAADLAHWIAQMLYLRTWRPTERQLAAEAARHQAEEAHS